MAGGAQLGPGHCCSANASEPEQATSTEPFQPYATRTLRMWQGMQGDFSLEATHSAWVKSKESFIEDGDDPSWR